MEAGMREEAKSLYSWAQTLAPPHLVLGVGPPSQVASAREGRVLGEVSGFGLKCTSINQGVQTPG